MSFSGIRRASEETREGETARMKKKRRGRPRLEDPRIPWMVRLNDAEHGLICRAAELAGVSTTDFIREGSLSRAKRLLKKHGEQI